MRKMIPILQVIKSRKKTYQFAIIHLKKTDWDGSYDPDFKFLKNAKIQSDSQKNVFGSKIKFLLSAEYDHRLKIKNVVVADQKQVLTKAFAFVACPVWYDNVTRFCFW